MISYIRLTLSHLLIVLHADTRLFVFLLLKTYLHMQAPKCILF